MSSRITRFLGSEKPIDHYELKVRKPGGTGWANPTNAFRNFETELENTDDLDEPLDREVVENTAESEGWPPGNYAMEAKGPDGSVVGYDWNDLHIEPDEDDFPF